MVFVNVCCYSRVNVDESGGISDSVCNVERQAGDSTDRSNFEEPFTEASHAARDDVPAPVRQLSEADFNQLRLVATFARLPSCLMNSTRPLLLARDGFFYSGRRRVCCFSCGVEVQLLDRNESSPQDQHRLLSPHCSHVGVRHPSSEARALLRDILLWMPLAVDIRRPGIIHHDLFTYK